MTDSWMADLISREAAIAWFFRPYSNEESYSNIDIERALKAIPAVDAVPVVRCKDCMYWKSNMLTHFWKPCDVIKTDKDWYCPCGRR